MAEAIKGWDINGILTAATPDLNNLRVPPHGWNRMFLCYYVFNHDGSRVHINLCLLPSSIKLPSIKRSQEFLRGLVIPNKLQRSRENTDGPGWNLHLM